MNERQNGILEMLLSKPVVTVLQISDHFSVSEVTVRSDLNHLEKLGRVTRTRGGARLAGERVRQEYSFATRQRINASQKYKIGRLAAGLINPMESILLDSSTTAVAVAHALCERDELKDITVVPTGLWTAIEVLACPSINVLLTGGYVRHTTGSITGMPANEFLRSFNFHKAFLGAWGVAVDDGLSDSHLLEVELKRLIVERAQEVIVVVDGSKFGRKALASYASLAQVSRIITDDSVPEKILSDFHKNGANILVAS